MAMQFRESDHINSLFLLVEYVPVQANFGTNKKKLPSLTLEKRL